MIRFISFLLVLMLFIGCPAPIPNVDEPAANLDIAFAVSDLETTPSDGKVLITATFSINGAAAEIASGITVTCNDVNLAPNALFGYIARVPLLLPGMAYTLTYTRAGVATTVSIAAQPRPMITTPAPNATISRSAGVTLVYRASTGTNVRGGAASTMSAVLGNAQPDNGTYVGLDISKLQAGTGTVNLLREFDSTVSNSGFKSAQVTLTTGSPDVAVTWN